MPFCTRASGPSKVALVLLFPALGVHIAGYDTLYWMKSKIVGGDLDFVVGLWKLKNCTTVDPCVTVDLPDSYITPFLHVTRALMTIPIVLIPLATILSIFYVTSPGARVQSVAAWMMMLLFLSAGVTLGGAITYAIDVPSEHYVLWSYGLTIIAASVCIVSATLMIKDIRDFDYAGIQQKKAEKKRKKKRKKEERERLDNIDKSELYRY